MKSFVRVSRDIALLVARLVLGGAALLHGWQRWQVEGIESQIQQLAAQDVPQPQAFAWGVTMLELVGGTLLLFGVLTPVIGLLFVLQSALTIFWINGSQGPYLADGGYEYLAVTGALALLLAVFGAGRASIDQLFRRPENPLEHEELRYDESLAADPAARPQRNPPPDPAA